MIVNKVYKFRLYPNKEQEVLNKLRKRTTEAVTKIRTGKERQWYHLRE